MVVIISNANNLTLLENPGNKNHMTLFSWHIYFYPSSQDWDTFSWFVAKRGSRRDAGVLSLSRSSMLASCVPGVFLHIKSQQFKLAILKTTETSVVFLFIHLLFMPRNKVIFIAPGGFFWRHKPKEQILCSPFFGVIWLSLRLCGIYLYLFSLRHCLALSVCLPVIVRV